MKIFISILFSVFFVHVALSDINPDPILCLSGYMYCGPGQYVPAGSSECAECPNRCGPTRKMVIDEAVPQVCPSLNNSVFCGYDIPGTRGFFCPGGCISITSADIGYNRGYEECPLGFPDPESKAQEDNKKCYTTFLFYPGAGATFMGDDFTSDTAYREEKMYYADNSDVFDYNFSTGKHTLNTAFIGTGSQVPHKTHYFFDNWNWDTVNGKVTVKADTNITSTSDIPATYASSVSKRLYAKWIYRVQYNNPSDINVAIAKPASPGKAYELLNNTVDNGLGFTKEGHIFAGWCLVADDCPEEKLFQPGDKICDADGCGNDVKKITPNTNGYLHLYAHFQECTGDTVADTATNKCVCKKGYYKTGEICTACDDGKTTSGPGDNSESDCGYFFKYGTNKAWTWPTEHLSLGDINLHP